MWGALPHVPRCSSPELPATAASSAYTPPCWGSSWRLWAPASSSPPHQTRLHPPPSTCATKRLIVGDGTDPDEQKIHWIWYLLSVSGLSEILRTHTHTHNRTHVTWGLCYICWPQRSSLASWKDCFRCSSRPQQQTELCPPGSKHRWTSLQSHLLQTWLLTWKIKDNWRCLFDLFVKSLTVLKFKQFKNFQSR